MIFVTLYNHLPRVHFWAKRSLSGHLSIYLFIYIQCFSARYLIKSELLNLLCTFMEQFICYIHGKVCTLSCVQYDHTICLKNIAYPTSQHVATLTHYFSGILCDYIKPLDTCKPSHECSEQIDP